MPPVDLFFDGRFTYFTKLLNMVLAIENKLTIAEHFFFKILVYDFKQGFVLF